jgi:hypothetical protein
MKWKLIYIISFFYIYIHIKYKYIYIFGIYNIPPCCCVIRSYSIWCPSLSLSFTYIRTHALTQPSLMYDGENMFVLYLILYTVFKNNHSRLSLFIFLYCTSRRNNDVTKIFETTKKWNCSNSFLDWCDSGLNVISASGIFAFSRSIRARKDLEWFQTWISFSISF